MGPLRIPASWVLVLGVLILLYGVFDGLGSGNWTNALDGLMLIAIALAWMGFWWVIGGGLVSWWRESGPGAQGADRRFLTEIQRLVQTKEPGLLWRVGWRRGEDSFGYPCNLLVVTGSHRDDGLQTDYAERVSKTIYDALDHITSAAGLAGIVNVRIELGDGKWLERDTRGALTTSEAA